MGALRGMVRCLVLGAFLGLLPAQLAHGQGILLPGAGANHLSMAGASTARATDALGAMYWNPATIRGLPRNEVVIGGTAIIPDAHIGSTVPAGAFGALGPDTTLSGYTRSDSGVALAPGLAVVYHPEGMPFSFGLGMVGLAAGGVNFPGDPSNPILAPTGPLDAGVSVRPSIGQVPNIAFDPRRPGGRVDRLVQSLNGRIDNLNRRLANLDQRIDQFNPGLILGPQAASLAVLSLMPSVAYQVTDRLVVAGGPIVSVSSISSDPGYFGPLVRGGDGLAYFPPATHSRPFWGLGFRGGFTYQITDNLVAGFSYTSPQWFETWKFNARNDVGDPIQFSTNLTLPQIFSAGVSYDGIDRLLLSADLRWIDYRSTRLLGQPPQQGGTGWDSVWAIALGARYQVTDQLSVSMGYLFNENPIPNNLAVLNAQLPGLTQHTLTLGAYFQMNESIGLSAAYMHGFKNTISGSPFPAFNTSTTLDTEYDAFVFGLHIAFGAPRDRSAVVQAEALPQ